MDSLSTAEQVLSKMIEIIGGGDPSPAKIGTGMNEMIAFDDNSDMNEMAPSMSNNVRIRSRRIKREAEDTDNHHGPKVLPTIDDMSMDSNETISIYSDLPDSPQEVKRSNIMQPPSSPGRDNSDNSAGGSAGGADEHDSGNRLFVKKSSSRITSDAHRKIAQEQRRKKLAERMGAQGEVDESGLANMAKFKAQQQAMDGLSYHMHPPTLPKSVTLRDDPMTKTQAFLTNMPELK